MPSSLLASYNIHNGKSLQGRIQDLKKKGAQWVLGARSKDFLANFLKNLGQKGVGVRPPPPAPPS